VEDKACCVICPGCGWIGDVSGLGRWGECPKCRYENGLSPYRLLTVAEMREGEVVYDDVRLDLFLASYDRFLKDGG
jgi:hypothetical protein